ncbi:hypothetical protein [Streptomyces aureus]
MRRIPLKRLVPYAIGGTWLIGSIVLRVHSWHERAFVAAFLLGACCYGLLFHRWRQEDDMAARRWCLGGAALWALTVAVASFDDGAATPVAGLAVLVGVVGALTLARTARPRAKPDPGTPDH